MLEDCLVKNILDSFPSERGAFHVLRSLHTLGHSLPGLPADWPLLVLCQFHQGCLVLSQVRLGANQEEGNTRAVMPDFWDPLFLDVFKGGWESYREADEEDRSIWIRDCPQSVVAILSCCVKELQFQVTE